MNEIRTSVTRRVTEWDDLFPVVRDIDWEEADRIANALYAAECRPGPRPFQITIAIPDWVRDLLPTPQGA